MNTRILLISFLAAAALAAVATPARARSYVVVGCSDLGTHTVRPTDGWYLAAGGYPSRDDCRRGPLTQVSGRFRGERIPRAGLRLWLRSRGFGGWRTHAILHTDGLGRFSASGRAPRGATFSASSSRRSAATRARGVGRP